VAIAANGKLFSAANDSTVRIWQLQTGLHLATKKFDDHYCLSIALVQDGLAVLTCCATPKDHLQLWNPESLENVWAVHSNNAGVHRGIAASSNSRHAVSTCGDSLEILDYRTGECLAMLTGHSADVQSIQITPDGRYAVSGAWDKAVKIWDLDG